MVNSTKDTKLQPVSPVQIVNQLTAMNALTDSVFSGSPDMAAGFYSAYQKILSGFPQYLNKDTPDL